MEANSTPSCRHAQPKSDKSYWLFRLETWLVLAAILLIFQVFPSLFGSLLYIVDVRNWTWSAWVGVEVGLVAILVALRVWQNSDPSTPGL